METHLYIWYNQDFSIDLSQGRFHIEFYTDENVRGKTYRLYNGMHCKKGLDHMEFSKLTSFKTVLRRLCLFKDGSSAKPAFELRLAKQQNSYNSP